MTVPAGCRIRVGRDADLPAWLDLFDAAVGWLVATGRHGQWGSRPLSEAPAFQERVRGWLRAGGARVAEIGDRLVGAVQLGPAPAYAPAADRPEIYVEGLVVDRSEAGSGIGAALLRAAVDEARLAGLQQVRLDCWAGGDGGLVRYYDRLGFVRDRRIEVGAWTGQVLVCRDLG
jgi:GNAT superfamily N-acetyltransferase